MAEAPRSRLRFDDGCPDCGERLADLPLPFPGVVDDFDWQARDYDSFRLLMMQELAHRFPDRRRWTPADMEVVIVELLAAALDRASHSLDVIQAERYLDTARRPQSVRRLLKLIGYDAVAHTRRGNLEGLPPRPRVDNAPLSEPESDEEKLERYWRLEPTAMERARAEGPLLIGEQRRMVTLADHQAAVQRHPLVAATRARQVWSGAWNTIMIAVIPRDGLDLDKPLKVAAKGSSDAVAEPIWEEVIQFHSAAGALLPPVNASLTLRRVLKSLTEAWRMAGTEVLIEPARPAPVAFALSVQIQDHFYRSEVRQALKQAFSAEPGGFFEPGELGFGEDWYASDLIEAAMASEGVAVACLNRFKRMGRDWPDRTDAGFIEIEPDEYVQCLNERGRAQTGMWQLTIHGGIKG